MVRGAAARARAVSRGMSLLIAGVVRTLYSPAYGSGSAAGPGTSTPVRTVRTALSAGAGPGLPSTGTAPGRARRTPG
ncbi:hypothetical protein GCM10018771_56780 [Streptomyces cellulosae]|nr:hypothetical protein GCM10018771_56780 [Streptomyces cellulosae]